MRNFCSPYAALAALLLISLAPADASSPYVSFGGVEPLGIAVDPSVVCPPVDTLHPAYRKPARPVA